MAAWPAYLGRAAQASASPQCNVSRLCADAYSYYTTARSNGWACLGCRNFLSLYPAINVRPVLGIPRFGQKFAVGNKSRRP